MNWKKWLSYDPYKKLWSLIGGRPWTYISRDIYHKVEYVVLVGLFTLGYTVGHEMEISWKVFLIGIAVYSVGFIHGHFFWGRDYIPNQQGE